MWRIMEITTALTINYYGHLLLDDRTDAGHDILRVLLLIYPLLCEALTLT